MIEKGTSRFKETEVPNSINMLNKYILFVIVLFGCSNNSSKSNESNDCFNYPAKVKELKCEEVYDNARFILYNWLGSDDLSGVKYGQMELRYKNILTKEDSVAVFLNFYARDTASKSDSLSIVANGRVVLLKSANKAISAFIYPFANFSDDLDEGDPRLGIKLTDATSKFLKTGNNKVNDCFIQLVRKRDLIE